MMRHVAKIAMISALLALSAGAATTGPRMTETFEHEPDTRWRFFTDSVMGGVSRGQVEFLSRGGTSYARMTGTVSTENNGGFIQMRMTLPEAPPPSTRGIRLVARGNGQRYFVHLRTRGTVLPWQYYQAGFEVTRDWAEFRLPLARFTASGRLLRPTPQAGSIQSIGVVAFGRDHAAEIELREIGIY